MQVISWHSRGLQNTKTIPFTYDHTDKQPFAVGMPFSAHQSVVHLHVTIVMWSIYRKGRYPAPPMLPCSPILHPPNTQHSTTRHAVQRSHSCINNTTQERGWQLYQADSDLFYHFNSCTNITLLYQHYHTRRGWQLYQADSDLFYHFNQQRGVHNVCRR